VQSGTHGGWIPCPACERLPAGPWLAIILIPGPPRAAVTFVIVILALALTGWISAQISDVHPVRPIVRTAAIGVLSMAITYAAGHLFSP